MIAVISLSLVLAVILKLYAQRGVMQPRMTGVDVRRRTEATTSPLVVNSRREDMMLTKLDFSSLLVDDVPRSRPDIEFVPVPNAYAKITRMAGRGKGTALLSQQFFASPILVPTYLSASPWVAVRFDLSIPAVWQIPPNDERYLLLP
jgi:hypothetical protein